MRWRAVNRSGEPLPPDGEVVIVWRRHLTAATLAFWEYENGGAVWHNAMPGAAEIVDVTHWMPLPGDPSIPTWEIVERPTGNTTRSPGTLVAKTGTSSHDGR
jgi:hypothetical protein